MLSQLQSGCPPNATADQVALIDGACRKLSQSSRELLEYAGDPSSAVDSFGGVFCSVVAGLQAFRISVIDPGADCTPLSFLVSGYKL